MGDRYNAGKMRIDLLPYEWIDGLGRVLTMGAAKYAPRNWEKGLSWGDTVASLERHFLAWKAGEDYDPESKLHHMIHVAWNALVLFSMSIRKIGKDDYPRVKYKGISSDENT